MRKVLEIKNPDEYLSVIKSSYDGDCLVKLTGVNSCEFTTNFHYAKPFWHRVIHTIGIDKVEIYSDCNDLHEFHVMKDDGTF